MTITHAFVSAIGDGGDATLARPSDWNAAHTIGSGTTLTSPIINGTIATTGLTIPAVTLGGAVALSGQIFNAGSGTAEIDTTGASVGFLLKSTQDGADGIRMTVQHISASPAVDDVLFDLTTIGKDSAGNDHQYHLVRFQTENVTNGSEAGRMSWYHSLSGAWNLAMTLSGAGVLNIVGSYQVDGVQVVGNRVIDARCDDVINSGDATTDGVIDALRDAMITHGLIAAP